MQSEKERPFLIKKLDILIKKLDTDKNIKKNTRTENLLLEKKIKTLI